MTYRLTEGLHMKLDQLNSFKFKTKTRNCKPLINRSWIFHDMMQIMLIIKRSHPVIVNIQGLQVKNSGQLRRKWKSASIKREKWINEAHLKTEEKL